VLNREQKENDVRWKDAIDEESKEMTKRGVWKIIYEKDIPSD
jgi:hypothetical protein